MTVWYPALSSAVESDVHPTIQQVNKGAALSTDSGQFPGGVRMNSGGGPNSGGKEGSMHPAFLAR